MFKDNLLLNNDSLLKILNPRHPIFKFSALKTQKNLFLPQYQKTLQQAKRHYFFITCLSFAYKTRPAKSFA